MSASVTSFILCICKPLFYVSISVCCIISYLFYKKQKDSPILTLKVMNGMEMTMYDDCTHLFSNLLLECLVANLKRLKCIVIIIYYSTLQCITRATVVCFNLPTVAPATDEEEEAFSWTTFFYQESSPQLSGTIAQGKLLLSNREKSGNSNK